MINININKLVNLIVSENQLEHKYERQEDVLEQKHQDNTIQYQEIEDKRNAVVMNSKASPLIYKVYQSIPSTKITELTTLTNDINLHLSHAHKNAKLVYRLIPNVFKVAVATFGQTPKQFLSTQPKEILNGLKLLTSELNNCNTMLAD